jgi:uncharacterized protein
LLLWVLCIANAASAADLAVVIDDVGYNKARGLRAINLPGAVTIAVLPFAPHTQALIHHAAKAGREIIVHQPMEPSASAHARSEHGTLTLAMNHEKFDALVKAALDAVPMRVGLSNHTGSLLTQHHGPMRRLMSQLNQRGLYFLDSRTTPQTVALDVAHQQGVPALKRDVFLDHNPRPQAIHLAFERAISLARKQGHAVLIGQPYPQSLAYLENRLAQLPRGINLVPASALVDRQSAPSRPAMLAQPPRLTSLHISPGQ